MQHSFNKARRINIKSTLLNNLFLISAKAFRGRGGKAFLFNIVYC